MSEKKRKDGRRVLKRNCGKTVEVNAPHEVQHRVIGAGSQDGPGTHTEARGDTLQAKIRRKAMEPDMPLEERLITSNSIASSDLQGTLQER